MQFLTLGPGFRILDLFSRFRGGNVTQNPIFGVSWPNSGVNCVKYLNQGRPIVVLRGGQLQNVLTVDPQLLRVQIDDIERARGAAAVREDVQLLVDHVVDHRNLGLDIFASTQLAERLRGGKSDQKTSLVSRPKL